MSTIFSHVIYLFSIHYEVLRELAPNSLSSFESSLKQEHLHSSIARKVPKSSSKMATHREGEDKSQFEKGEFHEASTRPTSGNHRF